MKRNFLLLSLVLCCLGLHAQDRIIKKNNKELNVKILSVDDDWIKYTIMSESTPTTYSLPKEDVKSYEYNVNAVPTKKVEIPESTDAYQKPNLIQTGNITIKPILPITSSSVFQYMTREFFVVSDAEDKNLIGKKVVAKIMQVRKSNMSGSEGRLIIRPLYIENDDKIIDLQPDDIMVRGKNRTNVKCLTAFTIVMAFWPGEGAKITMDEDFYVRVK